MIADSDAVGTAAAEEQARDSGAWILFLGSAVQWPSETPWDRHWLHFGLGCRGVRLLALGNALRAGPPVGFAPSRVSAIEGPSLLWRGGGGGGGSRIIATVFSFILIGGMLWWWQRLVSNRVSRESRGWWLCCLLFKIVIALKI